MTFPKLSGFIHFSKTFPGLENAVLKFHDFSRFFMTVRTLVYAYITATLMHVLGQMVKTLIKPQKEYNKTTI